MLGVSHSVAYNKDAGDVAGSCLGTMELAGLQEANDGTVGSAVTSVDSTVAVGSVPGLLLLPPPLLIG